MAGHRKLLNLTQRCLAPLRKQLDLASIDVDLLPGEVPVVEVSFPETDRHSIYITDAGSQLMCIVYLWRDADVISRQRAALMETLLDLNPSVPLSSFGRIDDHFVLVGSLSPAATVEDLALELATLSDNARDALSTLADFLKS
jgi:hypothetical protein